MSFTYNDDENSLCVALSLSNARPGLAEGKDSPRSGLCAALQKIFNSQVLRANKMMILISITVMVTMKFFFSNKQFSQIIFCEKKKSTILT
jgi:hypothetical protein